MRKFLGAAIFSLGMLCLPFWVENFHGAFRVSKIRIDLPSDPAWEAKTPAPEILSHPFSYLGKGAQAYVFESQDGQFVLKLFRGAPQCHPWLHWIRHNLLGKKEHKNEREKIPPLFKACKLAYERAPDLTGLVYLHLNPTKESLPVTTLIQSTCKRVPLNLNNFRFVLQKKGKPFVPTFQRAVERGDEGQFRRLAQSVVTLLQARMAKNIGNLDHTLWYNVGFLGETAIEWDFGRYYDNSSLECDALQKKERKMFTDSLHRFLDEMAPEWPIQLEELI